MDRLDSMTIFLAAVDGGSLSAAARHLGMPLASVSRKVAELEDHLRTQLVIRTSRRLALTDAGAAYVTACRRILDDIEEAERAASGEYRVPKGDLTVTAPVVFGRLHVEPILLDFLTVFPDISIRLLLADNVVNLFEEPIDLAVRIGALPDSSLVAARLGEISWVTCASPAYLARRGLPSKPEDLLTHDCVAFEGRYSAKTWSYSIGTETRALPVRPRFSVNTAEAAIDAAIAGTGITRVLSYQIAEPLRAGGLTLLLREFEPAPMPIHLVYLARPLLPLKMRAFLDFVAPRLKASFGHTARVLA